MEGTIKKFAAGDVIFRQGDPAGEMYVIRNGRVAVSLLDDGTPTTLATLKKGDFFGEMSFFDGKPRSATVTALDDLVVDAVSAAQFAAQVDDALREMIARLSGRIRAVDEMLEKASADDASRRDALSRIAIRRNLYY
jgi:CRP/FNR family cyclic AMP-dependent transcriptional regulator